jgi:hypothetical protein
MVRDKKNSLNTTTDPRVSVYGLLETTSEMRRLISDFHDMPIALYAESSTARARRRIADHQLNHVSQQLLRMEELLLLLMGKDPHHGYACIAGMDAHHESVSDAVAV